MPVETLRVEITERWDEDTLVFVAVYQHLQAEGGTEEQALARLRRRISVDRAEPRVVEMEVVVQEDPAVTELRRLQAMMGRHRSVGAEPIHNVPLNLAGLTLVAGSGIVDPSGFTVSESSFAPTQKNLAERNHYSLRLASAILPDAPHEDTSVYEMAHILSHLAIGDLRDAHKLLVKLEASRKLAPINSALSRFEIDPLV